jgi:hypothetical protein
MIDVDFRFRSDTVSRPAVDFVEFHEHELPSRLRAGNGELAARGIEVMGLPPIAIEVDGRSYTYVAENGTVEVRRSDAAAAAVAVMDAGVFSDLVQDLRSTGALMLTGAARMTRGSPLTFVEWEPALRSMVDGRRVYEPGSIALRDRDGHALDLNRSFRLGDSVEEMAHFLGQAGFLHIAGMFTPAEMVEIDADIDRAVPRYSSGDSRSWWARTSAGVQRIVRLKDFQHHSERTAALLRDPRYLSIADLTVNFPNGQPVSGGVDALIKPIGIVEGNSDLKWHKDCSLGRHSYDCCNIAVAFSITDSNDACGELCVLAGSHRALLPLHGVREGLDLPRVLLPTKKGDVTVHLSCTMHMSIPPKTAERRVMYSGLLLPPRAGTTGQGQDKLREVFFTSLGKT